MYHQTLLVACLTCLHLMVLGELLLLLFLLCLLLCLLLHLHFVLQFQCVMRPVLFISFLDYWQVTLIWSPYGDASLIRSLLIGDTSTIYYTDMAIRVTMTLY